MDLTILFNIVFVVLIYTKPFVSGRNFQIGQRQESKSLTIENLVTSLPGQPDVKFNHYSGYITVNRENGRALFYWFFEATSHPEEKPLVLWLNGGPGCSSVGYGATQEIGPFLVDNGGQRLKFNPYSWNKEANMLFLESPVGVGYSYSNTTSDYKILGDNFTANDAHVFLQEWFLRFPAFKSQEFYIAGESYAGKYVPELAEVILDKNNQPSMYINLRGVLMGNPETSDAEDWKGMVDYAWSHAVISDETKKTIDASCDFMSEDPWENEDCDQAVNELFKQYKEIDIYSLYTSLCIVDTASDKSANYSFTASSMMQMRRMMIGGYDPCLDNYAEIYYNNPDVQKALHVSDGHKLKNWSICNMEIFHGWSPSDRRGSVIPIYKKLIAAGLRVWVYSGDTDGRVPVLSTRYALNLLSLPIKKSWRPWYHMNQVSGWYQEYEGLTFATFRGAGHAVPIFKPSESLSFFSAFLFGNPLPSDRYS